MNKRFSFISTPLEGLKLIQREIMSDERGSFSRLFCVDEFSDLLNNPIIQINHSVNKVKGTTRGLHYQKPPFTETKIVTCIRGEIFDVVVDIRQGSDTFLQWYGEILSKENGKSLFIPEGFAHGFQTLQNECELIYLHTGRYRSDVEGGLQVLDPRLKIRWPLPISCISERDKLHSLINPNFYGVQS